MANMPDVNKRFVSALLTLEQIRRLDVAAKARKMKRSELLAFIIDTQLSNVILSSEDYRWIADQVEVNQKNRREK